MTAPEISQGVAIETICAELLAWVDSLPVKHPQQAALRERARAVLATPRTPAETREAQSDAAMDAMVAMTEDLHLYDWPVKPAVSTPAATGEGKVRDALRAMMEVYLRASPGAFANGVTDSTGMIDEGEVWAATAYDGARLALAALPPSSGCLSSISDNPACVSKTAADYQQRGWEAGGVEGSVDTPDKWEAVAEAMRGAAAQIAEEGVKSGSGFVIIDRRPDVVAAAIRALPLPPRPADSSGWQPIETAPRDGTRVLGGRNEAEGVDVIFGTEDGWFSQSREYSDWNAWPPTHWMPLPPPPSREG